MPRPFPAACSCQLGTLLSPYGLNGSHGAGGPPRRLTHAACAEMSAGLGLCPQRSHKTKVVVSRRLHRALRWWRVPASIKMGRALGPRVYRQQVCTDVSSLGWGAVHEGCGVNGVWTGRWLCQHINVLELRAVLLARLHFLPRLRGHHVIVRTDSTVTAAYINRQGNLSSPVCASSQPSCGSGLTHTSSRSESCTCQRY